MSSAFQLLQMAQSQAYKKYVFKKFSEMEIGDYPVSKFKFIKSNYGPLKRRLAVLMEGTPSPDETTVICLPERFNEALSTQAQVDDLNQRAYIMRYRGLDVAQKNRIDVTLHPMEDFGMDTVE